MAGSGLSATTPHTDMEIVPPSFPWFLWDKIADYLDSKTVINLSKVVDLSPRLGKMARAKHVIYDFLKSVVTNSTNENIFSPKYWANVLYEQDKRA